MYVIKVPFSTLAPNKSIQARPYISVYIHCISNFQELNALAVPSVPGESFAAQLMIPDEVKSVLNPYALEFVPRPSAEVGVNNVPSADDSHVIQNACYGSRRQ